MNNAKTDLQKAFQWARSRGYGAYQSGRNRGMTTIPTPALVALGMARKALAALPGLEEAAKAARAALEAQRAIDGRKYAPGMEAATAAHAKAAKTRDAGRDFLYSGPVWTRPRPDQEDALRNVQKAADFLDSREGSSFYCDTFRENTCDGFVAQLPSRNGRARFVAGYGFSHCDGGASFDLTRVFESDFKAERESARRQIGKAYWTPAMEAAGYWAESAHETARKEAAKAAAGMAEHEAEKEREYQSAWQAGARWAALKEEEEAARAEALAILAERRAARGINPAGFPALCAALRGQVAGLCRDIAKSRAKRAELAQGNAGEESFWPGEERLREAFCEGAELAGFPA